MEFLDFFFFPSLFVFVEEMAVNKHGCDSLEALPVPIKLRRDHHNERWPWHNWDSSLQKPDSRGDRVGSEWERERGRGKMGDQKHTIINTTFCLWGESQLFGWQDLNLNFDKMCISKTSWTMGTCNVPAGIKWIHKAQATVCYRLYFNHES